MPNVQWTGITQQVRRALELPQALATTPQPTHSPTGRRDANQNRPCSRLGACISKNDGPHCNRLYRVEDATAPVYWTALSLGTQVCAALDGPLPANGLATMRRLRMIVHLIASTHSCRLGTAMGCRARAHRLRSEPRRVSPGWLPSPARGDVRSGVWKRRRRWVRRLADLQRFASVSVRWRSDQRVFVEPPTQPRDLDRVSRSS
jgi:hypothetical protein